MRLTRQVIVTLECFPQNGVVRLFGHLTAATSMEGREIPAQAVNHTVPGGLLITDSEVDMVESNIGTIVCDISQKCGPWGVFALQILKWL